MLNGFLKAQSDSRLLLLLLSKASRDQTLSSLTRSAASAPDPQRISPRPAPAVCSSGTSTPPSAPGAPDSSWRPGSPRGIPGRSSAGRSGRQASSRGWGAAHRKPLEARVRRQREARCLVPGQDAGQEGYQQVQEQATISSLTVFVSLRSKHAKSTGWFRFGK